MTSPGSNADAPLTDDDIQRKWEEMAALVERLVGRIADPGDFFVTPGSGLAGDDAAAHPFEVSQAVRHLIHAAVDQLSGLTSLVLMVGDRHLAVGATLARAALENLAVGLWIMGPRNRGVRLTRVLKWHAQNYIDERTTMGERVGTAPAEHLLQVADMAASRGLPRVDRGYAIATAMKESELYTDLQVRFWWSISSGFAHGRPWAFRGLLRNERLTVDEGGHEVWVQRPRPELQLRLALQAVHLLGQLLRLRDRRAGLKMPAQPDGSPDGEYLPSADRNHSQP